MKTGFVTVFAAALVALPAICYASVPVVQVPEPSISALIALGLGGAALRMFRKPRAK